ncbi:LPXTG cell wall anchor domain-containing protein [Methanosarcina sp. 2.H.A.1B.4]|uniref:LPXTG cell wall anchor domain-containing protein n=1 Tax=Methanosarcina sp. 2.H.A.1B.4 TaxID=1483600 RepID=UPI000698F4F9|nr:LPXTG cell wall anchor domain-containing protein [Methanosarcina sp. 2.H.A.1B.4]
MTASAGVTGTGRAGKTNTSSGTSSYLLYLLIVVVAGAGVFLYRRKKQGVKMGTQKVEDKASENNSGSGMLKN